MNSGRFNRSDLLKPKTSISRRNAGFSVLVEKMLCQVYLNLGWSQATNVWCFFYLLLVLGRQTPSGHQPLDYKSLHHSGLPPSPAPSKTISKHRGIWSSFLIQWTGRRSNPKPPGIRADANRRTADPTIEPKLCFYCPDRFCVLSLLRFLSVSCFWNAKLILRSGDLL